MRHKIYAAARRRIIEIWHYTDKAWGEKQADKYVRELYQAIEKPLLIDICGGRLSMKM